MDITVFGLQRSGTNFLEQCIKKNVLDVKVKNQWRVGFWKHGYNFEEKPEYDPEKKLPTGAYGGKEVYRKLLNNEHKFVYIHKHPYNWIQSICNKKVDILKTQPDMMNTNKEFPKSDQFFMFEQIDILRTARFWTMHVKWWYDLRKKIIDLHGKDPNYYVSYENLIQSSEQTLWHCKNISERFGLPYHNVNIVPQTVGQSDRFSEQKRQNYVEIKLKGFHWNHISEINKYIDKELMDLLGYKIITTETEFNKHRTSVL